MGRNIWGFAGVVVAVAAVGQYVHARSARLHANDVACHIRTEAGPSTAPVKAVEVLVPYENAVHGIRIDRPAKWVLQSTDQSVQFTDPKSSIVIHLDVPKLSVTASWIPMGMVTSGYVKDLKDHGMPDVKSDPATDFTAVPAATGKRICCHGTETGSPIEDSAVFLVHDHRIFILSVDSNLTDSPRARNLLDSAVGSIQWLR